MSFKKRKSYRIPKISEIQIGRNFDIHNGKSWVPISVPPDASFMVLLKARIRSKTIRIKLIDHNDLNTLGFVPHGNMYWINSKKQLLLRTKDFRIWSFSILLSRSIEMKRFTNAKIDNIHDLVMFMNKTLTGSKKRKFKL